MEIVIAQTWLYTLQNELKIGMVVFFFFFSLFVDSEALEGSSSDELGNGLTPSAGV